MTVIKNLKPLEVQGFIDTHPQTVLIDVRTRMEFAYVGHPVDAVHIAWKEAPDWSINPEFLEQVDAAVGNRDTPVALICRSGNRSMDAARALEQAGYSCLINVDEGFEGDRDPQGHRGQLGGWRFHGLPWVQS